MATAVRTNPSEIIEFWFGDALASPKHARARAEVWFGKNEDFDREIRNRFGALPELAAKDRLDAWRDEASSALALVLVLDQFPRNLYRGSTRAFAFDSHALATALGAIARGFDRTLNEIQASFFYLPLEHAEDIEHQDQAVRLFEELTARADSELRPMFESFTTYARRHRDVIQRFGRFPHRNAVLNRQATPEEAAYLESGGDRFG
jgi:uncharacterized protein (DUF924 family)